MKQSLILVGAILVSTSLTGVAYAETSGMRIALSNNYAGNSWRQAMLESWEKVTSQAVADGIVAAVDTFTTADQEVPTQAAQVQNLILQGYDAIVINAASPDALNGAVKAACDAGIVVVSFDGVVSEPCAWRVAVDYRQLGQQQLDYLAGRLPDGGNLLEIRGLAGTSIDNLIHEGIADGVKTHPNFTIVGEATGDWDQATAQRAVSTVLPSLPEVDAIVTQGGDGYGAAQAFRAAGRDVPIIIMGNRQDELAWWQEQRDANGYETWSGTIAPGVSTLAFWVAQQILDGKEIPKDVIVPYLTVTQETLDEAVANTPVGGVANKEYSQEEAIQAIEDNL
ncbi:ABC transporter substrate-binding protein [Devosia sp. YIM 151766]|uniref:ABC transporter substrate-binding protein n=1 Tax=Devosia sp. YIM 151766 TaxID=3017325 RepID=UPI00255CC515|nr:ABC transporter substrate-binding protein [Devosia sp. YIM 151766]WIY53226.1 ABC transporter substrate-binding protein [Devosia sp. YIM 151766]